MSVARRNPFARLIKSTRHAVAVCCFALVLAQPSTLTPQPSEEAAIKQVVEQMFAAFAKKDLNGVMACWSAKSPQFAVVKSVAQAHFAVDAHATNIQFLRLKIEGDKATVHLRFDLKWRDAQTNQLDQLTKVWDIQFVKEDGLWHWWKQSDAIQDFANTLSQTQSKEERAQLLKDEKELVTVALVRMLYNAGDLRAKQFKFADALRLNDIAIEVAELLGDKSALAWCYTSRAFIFYGQSQYPLSLEHYQRALLLFREVKDKRGEGAALNNMGAAYQAAGKYAEALAQFKESLKIAQEIGDKVGEGQTLNSIGGVYLYFTRAHFEGGTISRG